MEGLVGELADDDPVDPRAELLERRREQVVGERAFGRQALELHRDGAGLPRTDPDREVAVAGGLLEDHHVAAGEHVDPDALDDHLDQSVVHGRIIPRSAGSPARATGAPTHDDRAGPSGRRPTKPPMWAKNATPPPLWTTPSEASPSMSWRTNQKPEDDDRRHVDELVEEAEEDERGDPRPREEHEVGAQRRGDRPRGADRRDRRGRVDGDLGQARPARRRAGRSRGSRPARSRSSTLFAEDPQVEHVAEQVEPAAVQELAGDERRGLARQVVAAGPGRGQVGRDDAPRA